MEQEPIHIFPNSERLSHIMRADCECGTTIEHLEDGGVIILHSRFGDRDITKKVATEGKWPQLN